MKTAVLALVRAYQLLLRPVFPAACRFEPSCSLYALDAVRRHGAARGLWLALKRLSCCHPFYNPQHG